MADFPLILSSTGVLRFNVAITRAKELMVIIGNMNCHKVLVIQAREE
jgi:hypothetical protein